MSEKSDRLHRTLKRAASHRDRMVPEGGEVRQENSKSGMRYRPKENGIITDF